jgi:group I intron endonuclease
MKNNKIKMKNTSNNKDKNSINSYLVGNYLDNKDIKYIKTYEDAYEMRKNILKENKGKVGIYLLTNKLTSDIYIGQSIDISKRFQNYFNLSYIKSKDSFKISRALIKYGYSNFSVTILEYCDKSNLLVREQYYFDKLNPQYNILKIAGSSLDFKHSEETKAKISKSLKGIYVNEKSALFGRSHTEETKKLMSLKKAKENNPLFGKIHSKNSKELIRQKALGRIHSEDTKLKMSVIHGNPLNIYEKCSSEEFKLIGSFVSARRAGKFLEISGSTVIRYMNSGEIFKDRYKFSSK